jgi:hypothetical protein
MGRTYASAGDKAAYQTSRIVASIDRLYEGINNGQLAANVVLDSQRLSEATDRSTRFRQGYGTNQNPNVHA